MADNVNIIVQDTINDIVVNSAVTVETIDINIQVAVDEVTIIANPNEYIINVNRIIGEQVQSDWNETDNQAPDYIKNKPTIPSIDGLATVIYVDQQDALKVDKVTGYGLSKNDFTDTLKTKLDGIQDGAEVNVNADWNATSGDAQILNKPTIPAAVTKTSDLINDGEDGVHPFITIEDVPTPTNGLPIGGTAGQILTKIDSVDYNATWQENYADWTSVVKHTVKNNGLSGTITKGTAVYVTGSNGTNMLVGRASNVSEATSSKTMGLIQTDITTTGTTQTGFVIAEGLLQGLNTAGQTAGDPVWLGVNGALIYGLINKPYAPSHLVFIGIVTKVSAGNGEIFVKVQNGFELKEIHDVDVITTTPINGHILGFDGTLWVNKTVAGWLGFTPGTVTSVSALTLGTTGTDLSSTVANGTTTPVITLNVPTASATNRGALSTTDWTTFNGKFTLPSLTSGSVLFSNGTTIAQDNSNFFWDNTNKRLNIGGITSNAARLGIKAPGALSTDIALRVRNSADTADLFTIGGTGVLFTQSLNVGFTGLGISYDTGIGLNIGSIGSGNGFTINLMDNSNNIYGFFGRVGSILTDRNATGRAVLTGTSALLEMQSTTKGFLLPRMTTTQKNAIATPASGLVVYDTTLGKLCVRGAASWETITSL